ncbi:MAG: IS1 family transposase [Owenweeksia sp.]
MECGKCNKPCVKRGFQSNGVQRYYCRVCKLNQQQRYAYKAYQAEINSILIAYLKEGLGIRSIARLLEISPNTVMNRIIAISNDVEKPPTSLGKTYEMDELCTYIGNKSRRMWIAYAIRKDTREVVDFKVGRRNNKTLGKVINTLTLSSATKIYTDKLHIYKNLIDKAIHKVKNRGINYIERKNLTLRTHLKRLNRKTICYSKSIAMLTACLKIYFWG